MSGFKKFFLLLLTAIVISTPIAKISLAESFSDISEGNQYYVGINYLKEQSIIEGYEDGTFKPSQEIDRASALKMLTLASGIFSQQEIDNLEIGNERPFQDTPIDQWYTKYLIAAKEKGIISGYSDGTFRPWKNINLAETLKIFFESFEDLSYPALEGNLVDDTPINSWFAKYTAYAIPQGIVNIYPLNTINPNQDMTRGYLAEIIYRMLKSQEGYKFGKATWYGAAVQGNGTASGEIFDKNLATAAHVNLPFGTIVEVTNLANGKTINMKINDRGPYGPGRVLDLSSSAFAQIAALGTGIIYVQYKVVPSI